MAHDNTARGNARTDIDRLTNRLALLSGELMMFSASVSTFGCDARRMRAMEAIRTASNDVRHASTSLAAASREIRAIKVR